MGHLSTLQDAMARAGLDALLLGGEAAGQFAAGHTRIGVHMPGWPIPVTVVPRSGTPHVVTADPDGAPDLPADHVHGMMWNPQTLVGSLRDWLDVQTELRIGTDAFSPGGRALIEAALPSAEIVDATSVVADAMLVKSPDEISALGELCRFVTAAAEAGLSAGRPALLRALGGAFPISHPRVGAGAVLVAVRRAGLIGEARLGPGDPAIGRRALAVLRAGPTAAELAAELPAGVEVVGIGGSYEPPLLRGGSASPADLVLRPGAVLAIHWAQCGVTVALTEDEPQLLSRTPEEVAR